MKPENNLFKKNLEVLERRFPVIAYLVVNVNENDRDRICIEKSEAGDETAYVVTESGGRKYIESRIDPERAAAGKLRLIGGRKNVLLLGVGLGYLLKQLQAKINDLHRIIITEKYVALLAEALKRADMTEILDREETHIILGYNPPENHVPQDTDDFVTIRNHSGTAPEDKYYRQVVRRIKQPHFYVLPGRDDEPLNVLLICQDSLRRDRVGLYGSPPRFCPTPEIDAFFEDGIILDGVSPSTWTPTVIASIISGLQPWEHCVLKEVSSTDTENRYKLPNRKFVSATYNLSCFNKLKIFLNANYWLVSRLGYGRGYHDSIPKGGWRGEQFNVLANEYFAKLGDTPFFMYIHCMDTHQPYVSLPEASVTVEQIEKFAPRGGLVDPVYSRDFTEELSVYNSAVYTADLYFGQIIKILQIHRLLEKTIVVFFSDHGEELRERGRLRYPRHGHSLYNETLNVPIMIKAPPSHRGIARDLVRDGQGRRFNLKNLLPLLRCIETGNEPAKPLFDDMIFSMTGFEGLLAYVIHNDFKLIADLQNNTRQLFNLRDDERELNNIHTRNNRHAGELESALFAEIPRDFTIPVDEFETKPDDEEMREIKKRLEDLGYV